MERLHAGEELTDQEARRRLDIAQRSIARDSTEWHDFCANCGQIPDNVKNTKIMILAFTDWLFEG